MKGTWQEWEKNEARIKGRNQKTSLCDFQKPLPFLGCLLKIMYLCRVIQMTKEESNQNGDMEWMRRLTRFNQKPVPVFLQQINSDTFLKTTENYQNGIIHSFLNILESAIRDGVSDKRINSLIGDATTVH